MTAVPAAPAKSPAPAPAHPADRAASVQRPEDKGGLAFAGILEGVSTARPRAPTPEEIPSRTRAPQESGRRDPREGRSTDPANSFTPALSPFLVPSVVEASQPVATNTGRPAKNAISSLTAPEPPLAVAARPLGEAVVARLVSMRNFILPARSDLSGPEIGDGARRGGKRKVGSGRSRRRSEKKPVRRGCAGRAFDDSEGAFAKNSDACGAKHTSPPVAIRPQRRQLRAFQPLRTGIPGTQGRRLTRTGVRRPRERRVRRSAPVKPLGRRRACAGRPRRGTSFCGRSARIAGCDAGDRPVGECAGSGDRPRPFAGRARGRDDDHAAHRGKTKRRHPRPESADRRRD